MMKLELNREYPERDDQKVFKKMEDLTLARMKVIEGGSLRGQHAKATGCVIGTFQIAANIPPELKFGILQQPGKVFKAYVRFSNADGTIENDEKRTARGMAIKLLNVNGQRALAGDDDDTQDFLMVNHPVFPFANPLEYTRFMSLLNNPRFGLVVALGYLFFRNPKGFFAALAIKLKRNMVSPLTARYWSGSPYWLGDASGVSGHAVKYSVSPRHIDNLTSPDGPQPLADNYLTQALIDHLRKREAVFDFHVQLQKDAAAMPIEDVSAKWKETVSKPITVATLTIPIQDVDPTKFEPMSFNPWHALAEHRPMGGINRLRKGVYARSVAERKARSAVPTTANAAASD